MNRKIGIWIFVMIPSFLEGATLEKPQPQEFKINRQIIKFFRLENPKVLISSSCVTDESKLKDCDASKALSKASLKFAADDELGRNPGALICSKQLEGQVVWSKDAKGNETTFCLFKDQPLLSSGSLTQAAAQAAKKQ